jgi:hypothetical protein
MAKRQQATFIGYVLFADFGPNWNKLDLESSRDGHVALALLEASVAAGGQCDQPLGMTNTVRAPIAITHPRTLVGGHFEGFEVSADGLSSRRTEREEKTGSSISEGLKPGIVWLLVGLAVGRRYRHSIRPRQPEQRLKTATTRPPFSFTASIRSEDPELATSGSLTALRFGGPPGASAWRLLLI